MWTYDTYIYIEREQHNRLSHKKLYVARKTQAHTDGIMVMDRRAQLVYLVAAVWEKEEGYSVQILMILGLGLWIRVYLWVCMCVVKCQRVGSNSLDLITGTLLPKMTIMICQLHWAPLICLSLVTQLDLGCHAWPSHQDHHKSMVGIGPTRVLELERRL